MYKPMPMKFDSQMIFIYDGECPFCKHFAELLELKSELTNLEIKNARDCPPEIPPGYDMDINGAILIQNQKFYTGPQAINLICNQIKTPSDSLLSFLKIIFKSSSRTSLIFPLLIRARRIALIVKGVSRKILI